jgi:serine/threonine-protein kinase
MVGLEACRGLDAAHRAGLVHGGIRPNALVFGDDGRLRIAELGLASLVDDTWWDSSSAPQDVDIDRAKYASPEQARGEAPGVKSDVYALDLCLLESVTGQLPFVAESAVATLSARVDRLLPVSADLGPLAAVLERAGRPDPDDRSSAAEFGRALHQAAEKLPRPAPLALLSGAVAAAPAAGGDTTSPGGTRRPASVVAGTASVAVVERADDGEPGPGADAGGEREDGAATGSGIDESTCRVRPQRWRPLRVRSRPARPPRMRPFPTQRFPTQRFPVRPFPMRP